MPKCLTLLALAAVIASAEPETTLSGPILGTWDLVHAVWRHGPAKGTSYRTPTDEPLPSWCTIEPQVIKRTPGAWWKTLCVTTTNHPNVTIQGWECTLAEVRSGNYERTYQIYHNTETDTCIIMVIVPECDRTDPTMIVTLKRRPARRPGVRTSPSR